MKHFGKEVAIAITLIHSDVKDWLDNQQTITFTQPVRAPLLAVDSHGLEPNSWEPLHLRLGGGA